MVDKPQTDLVAYTGHVRDNAHLTDWPLGIAFDMPRSTCAASFERPIALGQRHDV